MNKYTASFITLGYMLYFIQCGFAMQVTMSPQSFSATLYPGQSITQNITFTADGVYVIDVNYKIDNSSVDPRINWITPLLVNHTTIAPFNIYLPVDTIPGVVTINFTLSLDSRKNISGLLGSDGYYFKSTQPGVIDRCFYLSLNTTSEPANQISCTKFPKDGQYFIYPSAIVTPNSSNGLMPVNSSVVLGMVPTVVHNTSLASTPVAPSNVSWGVWKKIIGWGCLILIVLAIVVYFKTRD